MKNALGRHVLAEVYGCDRHILDDLDSVQEIMKAAALKAGAEIREVAFHKFAPQGVSGVVVISESHLAIHTWPELGYAALDVFTCGDKVDPWTACDHVIGEFKAESVTASEMKRGIFEPLRRQVDKCRKGA
jgi:S-adenosylmethionine decarboxylase